MLLQAAKTKALDVINSLGLSDSLLRVIERRQKMDKYITYGGMVSKCIVSTHTRLVSHEVLPSNSSANTAIWHMHAAEDGQSCVIALTTSLSGTNTSCIERRIAFQAVVVIFLILLWRWLK